MRGFAILSFASFPLFAGPYEIAMDSDGSLGSGDWITGLIVGVLIIYGLFFGTTHVKIIIGIGVVIPFLLMLMTGNPLWMFSIYVLPFIVSGAIDKFSEKKDRMK